MKNENIETCSAELCLEHALKRREALQRSAKSPMTGRLSVRGTAQDLQHDRAEIEILIHALESPRLCGNCRFARPVRIGYNRAQTQRPEVICKAGESLQSLASGKFLYEIECPSFVPWDTE